MAGFGSCDGVCQSLFISLVRIFLGVEGILGVYERFVGFRDLLTRRIWLIGCFLRLCEGAVKGIDRSIFILVLIQNEAFILVYLVLKRLLVNVVLQTVHCRLERLSLRRHLGLLVGIARRYKILRLFYGFLEGGKAFICVEPAVVADFFGFGYK